MFGLAEISKAAHATLVDALVLGQKQKLLMKHVEEIVGSDSKMGQILSLTERVLKWKR